MTCAVPGKTGIKPEPRAANRGAQHQHRIAGTDPHAIDMALAEHGKKRQKEAKKRPQKRKNDVEVKDTAGREGAPELVVLGLELDRGRPQLLPEQGDLIK